MKVQLNVNAKFNDAIALAGTVIDVPDKQGRAMIKAGTAKVAPKEKETPAAKQDVDADDDVAEDGAGEY